MKLLIALLLCVYGCMAKGSYRAGVIVNSPKDDLNKYFQRVTDAGKSNVDIVLLPSSARIQESSYDETVLLLAKAAKQAGLYVVAHLYEKVWCQNRIEKIRSNLVFDREGTIIAVSRKPVDKVTNCTTSSPQITTFKTDFGVNFGLVMEEDLVLRNSDYFHDLKHIVVAGVWDSQIPFLSCDQFSSSWAFMNKVNLLTHTAIYTNRAVMKRGLEDILIADVVIDREETSTVPVVNPLKISNFPKEDLSQYITKPLDFEASLSGYKETVCHNTFCCEFDIKTSFIGKPTEVNYGLVAFDGLGHYGESQYIGIQSCRIDACAGLYKRSCNVRFENSTNINFDKVVITANFTKHSTQYPNIVSTQSINIDQFSFIKNGKQTTATLKDVNIFNFGIISRDFSNDAESVYIDSSVDSFNFYDYIFDDTVQEFVDYVWIRLRILIFVVSIYILEMM